MPSTLRFRIPLEPGDLTVASLAALEECERRVIALRYGANGFRDHSRREISYALGMEMGRVRQIEADALRKLLALRKPGSAIGTEIVCANMPQDSFPGVTDHTGTKVYRLTVDVVVDIGDRAGGYWALRGVGEPKLEEIRR